jgi:ABC-2 type transport system permease protein
MLLEVARWEFGRWFKLKEHIITLIVSAALSLLIFGGQNILQSFDSGKVKLTILKNEILPIDLPEESKFEITFTDLSGLDNYKRIINEGDTDGLLIIHTIDNIELLVSKKPTWLQELQSVMSSASRQVKLKESTVSLDQIEYILMPPEIKLSITGNGVRQAGSAEKISAGILIGLMLMGVFFGLAYQFVAITGEKQSRITEVIISAISPQTWIDGKIIGISLLSLALMFTYTLSTVIFVIISGSFGSGWSIPFSVSDPLLIVILFVVSITGFLFWNTFFSAIAATINNPNTSARGSLIMLPSIPVALAFFSFGNPDSIAMKILSYFPLTSSPVLSARMVLGEVSYVEIILSLTLLLVSTWYVRIAAGKIFATSILMYGKEPSWKEMLKWLRQTGKTQL